MTAYKKNVHGHYLIKGKKYEMLCGSRAQVYHGTAYKTSGGLKKDDIMMNKNGRIVSKAKHNTAKKEKRLLKAGYGTKKGKFGFVLVGSRKMKGTKKSKSKKQRGGIGGLKYSLSPEMIGEDMQQQM
jgi:DVNP family